MKIYKYMRDQARNESIQIISQYNAQCTEMKRRLKLEFNEEGENVSTVVSSQGMWSCFIQC